MKLAGSAVLLLFCALASAQEVNLTVHARVMLDEHRQSSNASNVVVWLNPIGSQAQQIPQSRPLILAQHHKRFEPHVLVVPVGAVVQFPNRDPFFHNVFSLFEGKRFDLGLYEAGTTRNVSFDRTGISYIFCNIHAEMSAVVVALDTPYFGVSNQKGEIVIPRVPVGRYIMHTWSETATPEALNALAREITVTETSSAIGTLSIPFGGATTAHKNKYGMDYEPPEPAGPAYSHP